MSVLAITIAALLASDEVTAIVADKVHAVRAPDPIDLPSLVVKLVTEDSPMLLAGPLGMRWSRVQIESLAETAGGADSLGETVIRALEPICRQMFDGREASFAKETTDFSDYADDLSLFRRLTDFRVIWR